MQQGKRVTVVMPAYNAESTLRRTFEEIPRQIVDDIIVVDDHSSDRTLEVARELSLYTLVHERNQGYGANQKTCYREALRRGADIVVMLHPDYQYTPKLIPALVSCISSGLYDIALGSRVLGGKALAGGMPRYKYISNRILTAAENLLVGAKLSEYHTGYRVFSRDVLLTLPLDECSNGFLFDNEILVQAVLFGYRIAEVTCPARYEPESSSIGLFASLRYGLGVLKTAAAYRLQRMGIVNSAIFRRDGARLKLS